MKSLYLHLGDHCLADEYRRAVEAIELQAATGGPLIATASALAADKPDLVALNQASMEAAGRKTGRSTMQAARTFSAKLQRAGGWGAMGSREQLDALHKGRYFASWLMVTGRLKVDATVSNDLDLQLGAVARAYCLPCPDVSRGSRALHQPCGGLRPPGGVEAWGRCRPVEVEPHYGVAVLGRSRAVPDTSRCIRAAEPPERRSWARAGQQGAHPHLGRLHQGPQGEEALSTGRPAVGA